MLNLEILGSLASHLHAEFRTLFYFMLPVFFALSLVFAWFRNPAGSPDFVDSIKRVIVASLLMAAFQEIAGTILTVTNGLAAKIGDMQSLDSYMQMVSEKAKSYPSSPMSVVLAVDDFFMAVLSYGSYLLLYLARSLMVAVYHFTWMFLIIMSPILLLFHVFTSKITLNLFKSLIEVASWQIVWAVLAVMLKALPYGNWIAAQDGYLTLIILNFIIAISMFLTPFLVKALVGGSFSAVAGSLIPITAFAAPGKFAKLGSVASVGREVIGDTANFVRASASSPFKRPQPTPERAEARQALLAHAGRTGERESQNSVSPKLPTTPNQEPENS